MRHDYTILVVDGNIDDMLLVDSHIHKDSEKDQDYYVVNGAYGGTYRGGKIYQRGKWVDVEVYNHIEYDGCYNEPICKLREELRYES